MSADALLARCAHLHRQRDWAGLAACFAPAGALHCRDAHAVGPDAIARLLRAHAHDDALLVGEGARQAGGAVAATYGWASQPDHVAGELRLEPHGEHIGRLDVVLPAPQIPRTRTSVRAVLVAPGPAVLLFRCGDPGRPDAWWITPGGGREPGEDDRAALRRELAEEIGVALDPQGGCAWTRTHTFVFAGEAVRQHERYFLVPAPERLTRRPR
ncbi:MAG: NUDIX domain-containing protein [Myxococcota bacterium]